ncbi:MAG TPA: putative molybdenum carrier protein [Opitutaceae bacterium]|nr:putative molybdenum carrier protein [Opitutaceae bacterium]
MNLQIISGGQTGADRAALDFARARGWPHGGWCPQGRRTEAGPLPPHYQLRETPSDAYAQRTEWNVRDSDGTVIFSLAHVLAGGAATTADCARRLNKPWLHLTPAAPEPAQRLRKFVATHGMRILNVAGPRASEEPQVAAFVRQVLEEAFPAGATNGADIRATAG